MGTYYSRLTEVADLDYDDSGELAQYQLVTELISGCREAAEGYRRDPGFSGRTAVAALDWITDFQTRLEAKAEALKIAVDRYNLAREAMLRAKAEHDKLSPQLLTSFERKLLPINGPYLLDGREVSGSEYTAHLAAERDAAREAAARRILTTMNDEVTEQKQLISVPLPILPSPASSPAKAPVKRAPSVPVPPHLVTRPPAPGVVPTPGAHPPVAERPVAPVTSPRTNPVAGYEPPSVLHRDDPAWSESYVHQPALNSGAGAVVGGMLAVGAKALLARSAGANMSGASALAFQNAAGPGSASTLGARAGVSAAAAGRVPGGGLLSNATNTANAANTANASAARKTDKTPTKGAAGAANKAQAGNNSAILSRKDRKKDDPAKTKPRRYLAEHLDQDPGEQPEPGPGAGAGNSANLKPLPTPDESERW